MRIIKALLLFVVILAGFSGIEAQADVFDDAVNLYLRGVDHCTAAKSALEAGNLAVARSEFNQYEQIRQQAVTLDGKILSSSRRGMDSNLKYCERVGNDIQVTEGRPVLEQGLAQCDQAIASLKSGKLDDARQHYQQFTEQRDKALKTAPGLKNIFSLTNEIRRCERVENKIAHFGQQQAALTQARDGVLEESEALRETCEAAVKEIDAAPLSEASLVDGNATLAKIQAHRKTADVDFQTFSALTQGQETKDKKRIEDSLSQADTCLGQFRTTLEARQVTLKTAQARLQHYADTLAQAEQSCRRSTGTATTGITQARYRHARAAYESARNSRDSIQAELARNSYYSNDDNGGWPQVRAINSRFAGLNRCLDSADRHLGKLLAALTPPATATKNEPPSVAVPAPTPAPNGVPAAKLEATLTLTDDIPDAVLLYWQDGTHPPVEQEVAVFPTGFDRKIYVVDQATDLRIRNTDFSRHRISADIDAIHFSVELASLGSHQVRDAHATWPQDTLATLRSQQRRIAPSYMANIESATYVTGSFAAGNKTLKLQLKNPHGAGKGMLLLPGFDPLSFTLYRGQSLSLPITRNKVMVGQLILKGV